MAPPERSSSLVIDLDPAEAERKRIARERRLNLVVIPALRVVGMSLLAVGVLLNNAVLLGSFSWAAWVRVTAGLELYALVSWLLLWALRSRLRPVDLGLFFLAFDLVVFAWVLASSGGEKSWLFFILIVRVADQTNTTFRRTLLFAHAAAFVYAGMLVWTGVIEGRDVSWPVGLSKTVFVYGSGLYISLTALTAERLRNTVASVVRMARGLIHELGDARERAEAASRAKSQFLATMSHELRTPLNSTIGFSQVLANRSFGELNERQREYVRLIQQSGGRLLRMIDDILEFSTAETGQLRLDLAPLDFGRIAREVLGGVEAAAREKRLTLATDVPADLPPVRADEAKLRQILANLLSNAIKFTRDGGSVTVGAGIEPAGDTDGPGRLRITVVDTGIGIRPEDHERIFQVFEQVDASPAREQEGTGLGLALTDRLVRLHGGRIWVESTGAAGEGSVFVVVIPLAPDADGRASATPPRR